MAEYHSHMFVKSTGIESFTIRLIGVTAVVLQPNLGLVGYWTGVLSK